MQTAIVHISDFPPQYSGSPMLYGFAIFGLTLVSAISLAHLISMGNDAHRYAMARRTLGVRGPEPLPWFTLLGSYRTIIAGLLLTILLGAFPDVVSLYAWGEVSMETMRTIWSIDRFLDGFVLLPFCTAMAMNAWVSQALPQRLAEVEQTPLQPPRSFMFVRYLKIVAIVLLIAAGVTIGKASG